MLPGREAVKKSLERQPNPPNHNAFTLAYFAGINTFVLQVWGCETESLAAAEASCERSHAR
jgi:hypothetical protein